MMKLFICFTFDADIMLAPNFLHFFTYRSKCSIHVYHGYIKDYTIYMLSCTYDTDIVLAPTT